MAFFFPFNPEELLAFRNCKIVEVFDKDPRYILDTFNEKGALPFNVFGIRHAVK